ncbi:hypothetical protein ACFVW1_06420 [Streptomyces olivochromogenes]|uniref:hypothetical protein n=1 Tax=Streptomyces olivochromogenes TaxID=1963 RepID=UPI0036D9782A
MQNGVTGGVRRVTAGDRSVVLKVLTRGKGTGGSWDASDDPRHWNFWRREAHVYESGLARSRQPWGITAPRLLASVDHPRRRGAAARLRRRKGGGRRTALPGAGVGLRLPCRLGGRGA